MCTVEPLIKDTPYKGHNRIHLHSKDTFCGPKCLFLHTYNTFLTSKKWTTSLKRTKNLVPMRPLFGGSTVDDSDRMSEVRISIVKSSLSIALATVSFQFR